MKQSTENETRKRRATSAIDSGTQIDDSSRIVREGDVPRYAGHGGLLGSTREGVRGPLGSVLPSSFADLGFGGRCPRFRIVFVTGFVAGLDWRRVDVSFGEEKREREVGRTVAIACDQARSWE